ncbi:phosphatidylglycerol lysyltransferase domain-containing protein [Streptococcus didelphis]|nr:phosphatidylglycerol lysyltransferase domain-containing protein [Streptococcus didelphis]WMB29201.1 phosphatidylglycerol lysyltransferase domain-containing protein [Streptococcus didelphis]
MTIKTYKDNKMLASKKTSRFHFKNKRLVNDLLKTLFFYVVVCLFYISGITLILMITSHDSIINLPIIKDKFYGLASIALIRQVPSLILGFSLLVCGRAIANRSAKAFYPTLIFLLLATLYTLVFYKSTAPTLLLALLAGLLFLSKDNLYRNQFIISHEDAFMDGFIWLFLIASYFILGYSNLVTSQKRSLVALEKHFAVPSLHWWLMGLLTLLAIIISLFLFLHLLKRKLYLIGSPFEEKRLEALLGKGDHHYTGLAFLQDKRLWYYQQDNQDKVALQFSQVRDKLLVMGDLFGEDAYFEKALNHFMTEADLYNFHPVFYEISEKQVMPVHDYGYDFIKLGKKAWLNQKRLPYQARKGKTYVLS